MRKLTFFSYIGGKSLLADVIIKLIPEHTIYVEPFGGSAKVLLNKPPSKIEVYNDADLMNQSLIKALRSKLITPEDALKTSPDSEELKRLMATLGVR
jgi:DNA adenine methylase